MKPPDSENRAAAPDEDGLLKTAESDATLTPDARSVKPLRSRTPEPPYCWQSKEARRLIRQHMNGESTTAALLSLYDALTEIASNEGSESFAAGQPHIGELAGMSARNVRRLEPILEEIGVVRITRPKVRGHHTYSLLSFGQSVPSFGQSVPSLGQSEFHPSCPPVEEHRKNIRSNSGKNRASRFDASSVDLPFCSPDFAEAWKSWCQHLKEIGKTIGPTSVKQLLDNLESMGEARAIAAIKHSIAQCFRAIYEAGTIGHKPATDSRRPSKYDNAW